MTQLAIGASKTIAVGDMGTVSIATNGGFGRYSGTTGLGVAFSRNFGPEPFRHVVGPFKEGGTVTIVNDSVNWMDVDAIPIDLVTMLAFNYVRWCIPGKDTSGTVFKDVSGKGNDGTIEASNTTPFAVDNRISTVAHGSAGGVVMSLAATQCDMATDSFLMGFMITNEDPASSEIVASYGAGPNAGVANAPGVYLSHRSSPAGVARIIFNKGNSTIVSGTDSTVKISNAGGTRETHCLMGYDAPTRSSYFYRDGVLAVSDIALMTGANAFTSTLVTLPARLGGIGGAQQSFAGIYRGWQGYVFAGKGLPLNISRIASILSENPSIPLADGNFSFA